MAIWLSPGGNNPGIFGTHAMLSSMNCIFVDWHGVLSADRFWHSLPPDSGAWPCIDALFADQQLIDRWMLGQVRSAEVIREAFPTEIQTEMLASLLRDCRTMRIDQELLHGLDVLTAQADFFIATDNMDCFADSIHSRPEIALFDDVLCSCRLGALKSSTAEFFGPTLAAKNSTWSQALLIDDDHANCEHFRRQGGTAIRFRSSDQALGEAGKWLKERTAHR